ncbi:MAG TPA: LapA family protein [Candidatus Bathyarchaeia archaeon]|nr:LapA family protein [Candidatus Bathyarchaeia archaeon]
MTFAYLLLVLVGAACAVFALQNMDPVVIRFVTWRIEGMPLSLVILVSVMGGLVFASCVGLLRHWKLRSRIRQLEARLAAAERSTPPPAP